MIADPLLIGVFAAVLVTHFLAFCLGWVLGCTRAERASQDAPFVGECVWPEAASDRGGKHLFHSGTHTPEA